MSSFKVLKATDVLFASEPVAAEPSAATLIKLPVGCCDKPM
jgi:hypothetical protein